MRNNTLGIFLIFCMLKCFPILVRRRCICYILKLDLNHRPPTPMTDPLDQSTALLFYLTVPDFFYLDTTSQKFRNLKYLRWSLQDWRHLHLYWDYNYSLIMLKHTENTCLIMILQIQDIGVPGVAREYKNVILLICEYAPHVLHV